MAILTSLCRQDFDEILSHYRIGRHISHKHVQCALGNTIYFLNTDAGRFVLKIFENSDPEFIAYQMRLVAVAEKKGLPVPNTILTRSGRMLLLFRGMRITIQKFVEGIYPRKLTNALVLDIARRQALLNKALSGIRLNGKYDWGGDYRFRLMSFEVKEFRGFNIRAEEDKILQALRGIDRKKLRRSHVHGDFHSVNLIIKNNRLKAILDWDDAHEDYLIHDIACFIAHSFVKSDIIYRNQIRLYLKEYQKFIMLNPEERKALYLFVKQRYLSSISWGLKQISKHGNIREKIEKNAWKSVMKYKSFARLNIEEFLRLC